MAGFAQNIKKLQILWIESYFTLYTQTSVICLGTFHCWHLHIVCNPTPHAEWMCPNSYKAPAVGCALTVQVYISFHAYLNITSEIVAWQKQRCDIPLF